MKDRSSRYPGRVKLIPVEGQPDVFDMQLVDEPIEVGTPLNTETLLNDAAVTAIDVYNSHFDNPVMTEDELNKLTVSDGFEILANNGDNIQSRVNALESGLATTDDLVDMNRQNILALDESKLEITGGTMQGNISMGG